MVIIGMHLFHAIGSAVQTMGINHQKWTPIINKLSILYCLAVAGGFAFTAVASWFIANMPATQELIQQSLRISEQLGGVK
jgi:succinate dehydrogenase / fumarate reductase cytochrome b subunit